MSGSIAGLCRAPAFAFLVGGLLSSAPVSAAAPAARFRVPPAARVVLPNGLQLLILEQRAVPLVQMQLLVKAGGTSDPPGQEGTAHLLSQLLKRGSPGRSASQFAEQVEFLGGSLEAEAGLERTLIFGEFGARDFEAGLTLLGEMVLAPSLPQEEFERERGLLLAGLEATLDDPGALASRAFGAWLFRDHPYGRPLDGTRRSLAALKRDDIAAFHRAQFVPGNAILALVGDFDAAAARTAAERRFNSWPKKTVAAKRLPELAPMRGRRVLLVDKPDATQSQIRFGHGLVARSDPALIPLTVVNTVLGSGFTSWLVDEVRVKRGLTYSINSALVARNTTGSFQVSTFSKNSTVLDTLNLSLDQVRRMRSGGLSEADLDKGRNYVSGLYPLRVESPDALALELLDGEFYGLGPDAINRYPERIRSVTLETARAAARRLSPDDLAVVVVGPASELRDPLAAVGPVTVRPAASVVSGEK